ncbi:MAG: hypothetical protein HC859_14250 [Bacteroidia bacterium]|nr:hypothetical protein [Bacteroidia bacterium]
MVRTLNYNKQQELMNELKAEFPGVTDAELQHVNDSFDELINSISLKTQRNKEQVAKIVNGKLERLYSKTI